MAKGDQFSTCLAVKDLLHDHTDSKKSITSNHDNYPADAKKL